MEENKPMTPAPDAAQAGDAPAPKTPAGALFYAAGKRARLYALSFLKWAGVSLAVGVLGGGVGTVFLYGIRFAGDSLAAYPWLLYLLPLGGLVIVGGYRLCRLPDGIGTNDVLIAVRTGGRVPPLLAPMILLGTVITHLLGGSAGREGAALQLGGSIGSFLGRACRLDEKDRQLCVLCGMSAVFGALFGTPLTAAFFAMEVVSVGVMYYAAFVPCLASALTAAAIAKWAGFAPVAFTLAGAPAFTLLSVLQTAGLAGMTALVSILFCVLLHQTAHLYQRFLPNPYLRAFVGGAIVIGLALLCGTRDYNGVGTAVIVRALAGSAVPAAFLLKALFTALTLGAGYKGGEIVPSFFVGAAFGCVAAPLCGLSPAFGAAVGLIGLFCGVTNAPVASLFLALEAFGGGAMPLFGVTVAFAFLFSGNFGIYSGQRILYSKLRAEFVDRRAH